MSRTEKASLRQRAFTDRCLQQNDVIERIREQWVGLCQFGSPSTLDDPEKLKQAANDLDLGLVQFSLTNLRTHLQETAIRDCALLAAERILDTSVTQETIERWEHWLAAAPCWPRLANENWFQAISKAADIVVNNLIDAGIKLNEESQGDLQREISMLQIADLLPMAVYERFFPISTTENEW
jgi:hypothetical protein